MKATEIKATMPTIEVLVKNELEQIERAITKAAIAGIGSIDYVMSIPGLNEKLVQKVTSELRENEFGVNQSHLNFSTSLANQYQTLTIIWSVN